MPSSSDAFIRRFLNDEWIDRRLATYSCSDREGTLRRSLTSAALGSIGGAGPHADLMVEIRECLTICDLEIARGVSIDGVRKRCRDLAVKFAPIVEKFDFSMETFRVNDGMLPSRAKRTAELHGGRWWKASQHHAGAEWSEMRQPLAADIPWLWMMAAAAGDQEIARSLARAYQVPPAKRIDPRVRYQVRNLILRHALADEHDGEQSLARWLQSGYPAGIAPQLVEFPMAIVRRDATMLRVAMKKIRTRFQTTLSVSRMRRWYAKRKHQRGIGTFEDVMERTKHALLADHWVVSWWAIAWLNIARWRGMTEIFSDSAAFSEFVPLQLCEAPTN